MDAVVGQREHGSGPGPGRLPGYALDRPGLVDLKQNLYRVLGPHGQAIWDRTLVATRLSGTETDLASLDLVLTALGTGEDPVAAVVARSMRVRLETYRRLAARGPEPTAQAEQAGPPQHSPTPSATPGATTVDTSRMAAQTPSSDSGARSASEGSVDPLTDLPVQRSAPDAGSSPNHLDALISYERLSEIAQYDVVNPELAARLDEIARRTMSELDQPCSYVSIVLDSAQLIIGSSGIEGWIKNVGGTPVEWSFCGHTVAHGRPYLVENAFTDPVHADSPLVRIEGTGSYAGVPLTTESGQVLGAHCVISTQPQTFSAENVAVLESAAQEIMALLRRYKVQIPPSSWDEAWSDASWEPVRED
jgi:hypothetical protein